MGKGMKTNISLVLVLCAVLLAGCRKADYKDPILKDRVTSLVAHLNSLMVSTELVAIAKSYEWRLSPEQAQYLKGAVAGADKAGEAYQTARELRSIMPSWEDFEAGSAQVRENLTRLADSL